MIKICIGIFLARIFDVSLGTLRTIFFVKGKTVIASSIAFFEVLIWFVVARQALNIDINSIWIPVSYALGYATGTLIGSFISNNYVSGLISIQVITQADNKELINSIRDSGYGLSIVDLKNDYDSVKREMYIIEVKKKSLKSLISLIKKFDASSFIMINETKIAQNGLIK